MYSAKAYRAWGRLDRSVAECTWKKRWPPQHTLHTLEGRHRAPLIFFSATGTLEAVGCAAEKQRTEREGIAVSVSNGFFRPGEDRGEGNKRAGWHDPLMR